MTPADRLIVAEMAVRAQNTILFGQREALRHSLDGLGNSTEAPWWRAAIAETERRIAQAEAALGELEHG